MTEILKINKLNKKQLKELKGRLLLGPRNVWDKSDITTREKIFELGEDYKKFLNQAKTERLAVKIIREQAEKFGFEILKSGAKGERFYINLHEKAIALVVLGRRELNYGIRIIGSHIDAPRLDVKVHPLYENQELVYLKTHYYGGIKKYQWLARPLAIHGILYSKEGKIIDFHVGDNSDDPVFTIQDLLPHLSRKVQNTKNLSDAFEAERMNLLIGSLPIDFYEEGINDRVKLSILNFLYEKYGVVEADLISAELEIVPAGKAQDVGFDRALVGSYGQDDRASVFCSLQAILDLKSPEITAISLFYDKEEIGSDGPTSAKSRWIELIIGLLMEIRGEDSSYLSINKTLINSQALSADVNAAYDPDYPEVYEKRNAAFLGYGITLTKHTGYGGKYEANDANAEYVAWLRYIWNEANIIWQASEMGKIDEGGGGTLAKFLAIYGMNIIDVGPALLSMHSPFEISHKADIWVSMRAFYAFFKAAPRQIINI